MKEAVMQTPQELLEGTVNEMRFCLQKVRSGEMDAFGATTRLANLGDLMHAVINYSVNTGHWHQATVLRSDEEIIAEASEVLPKEDVDALRKKCLEVWEAKQKK